MKISNYYLISDTIGAISNYYIISDIIGEYLIGIIIGKSQMGFLIIIS